MEKGNEFKMNIQLFGAPRPTTEQIVEAVVTAGGSSVVASSTAEALAPILAKSPQANDYVSEFNNKIEQRYNDLHSNATIYDRFKKSTGSPTVQAVVYERVSPVDFTFETDIDSLDKDEGTETAKLPDIHSILNSLNVQSRFKTTTSRIEINKIANGQAITVDNVVSNLGMSYADDRTEHFEKLVDEIESNKTKDEINPLQTMQDISNFIQTVKDYCFKWKKKRTDIYNAFKGKGAKADTKIEKDMKPIIFIKPKSLYKIESDFYAVLFQLEQALPDVEFVELDNLSGNKFATMIDPRVIIWEEFETELRSEQRRGRESGELNHYLFAKDIMGSFNCFNRVIFKTS